MREIAALLLTQEVGKDEGALSPAIKVCTKLGVLLTKLAGASGYRSLLARALALAKNEAPGLAEVTVEPDGSLTDTDKAHADPSTAEQGAVSLVSELLGLLHTFIGEALTLQLVQEAWPDISIPPATAGNTSEG
ncbi:MAG: hypothetical protein ACOH13_15580 [Flavobacteriales bacterium]